MNKTQIAETGEGNRQSLTEPDMESCVVCGKLAETCEHREEYERDFGSEEIK